MASPTSKNYSIKILILALVILGFALVFYTNKISISNSITTGLFVLSALLVIIAGYYSYKHLIISLNNIQNGIKTAKNGNWDNKFENISSNICKPIVEELEKLFTSIKNREYEIKAYEEELKSKKDNLEAIFNSSTDGIITLSSDLKIINVNPTITQWAGLTPEKIIGHHFNELIKCKCQIKMSDIDCTDPSVCPIASYWTDDMPKEGYMINSENGKVTYIGLNCSPIHGLTKAKESFVAVLMDITEFKELEKVKENFIATLTHDLRVPLLAEKHTLRYFIKGSYGELTENQKIAAENMLKSNQDLLKLVNTLLDVFKYESGTSQLYKEKVDLNKLICDCIDELYSLTEKNAQYICYNVPDNLPAIEADLNEIKRVLMNIISNAITYTPKKGKIEIKAEQNESQIIIKVIDNGKGIPENELKNIFDRYYTTAKKFRQVGRGLGLYLSKQIILAHNGKIWVESIENQGSTFFILLPIKSEENNNE